MPTPEKHRFQKINTDIEARYMTPDMYRYLLNGVVAASDGEHKGDVENAVGTRLLENINIGLTTEKTYTYTRIRNVASLRVYDLMPTYGDVSGDIVVGSTITTKSQNGVEDTHTITAVSYLNGLTSISTSTLFDVNTWGTLTTPATSVAATVITAYTDPESNTILYFVSDDTIWRFDPADDSFSLVLDWSGLALDLFITGVDVLNKNLIFTDNTNEVRKVHVDKFQDLNGVKTYKFVEIAPNIIFPALTLVYLDPEYGDISNLWPFTIGAPNEVELNVDTGAQPSGTFAVQSASFFNGRTLLQMVMTYVADGTGTIDDSFITKIKEEDITLLRRAPRLPLEISKTQDDDIEQNYLARNSFQFTYRYIYWDDEYSTYAPMSKMAFIDNRDDLRAHNNNNVICRIPDAEDIRFTVKKIEWVFRVDNTNEFAVFEVTTPNSRTVTFRNDVAGATIPDSEVLLSFHDVPLRAGGLKAVQDRIELNNYTVGFDKRNTFTMGVVVDPAGVVIANNQPIFERQIRKYDIFGGLLETTWEKYWWQDAGGFWWRISIEWDGVSTWHGTVDPGQGNGISNADMASYSEQSGLYTYTYSYPTAPVSRCTFCVAPQTVATVKAAPRTSTPMFKAGDTYQLGVRFSDNLGRNNGVYTSKESRITMPSFGSSSGSKYDMDLAPGNMSWTLPATPDDIPAWATHYEIVRTRNLSRSFFLQGHMLIWVYGKREVTTDDSKVLDLVQVFDAAYDVYINIGNLPKNKIGYVFSEGDRVRWQDQDAKIKGQDGAWLIVENPYTKDSTYLGLADPFFEIYTPYLGSLDESFFEIGEKFAITNPGEPTRAYSQLTGTMVGDIHRKKRDTYPIKPGYVLTPDPKVEVSDTPTLQDFEAMNPNDDYYEQWVSDAGRATVVLTDSRQQIQRYTLKYGGRYNVDAARNYMSEFNPGDEYNMPLENGPAVALAVTNNNLLYLHEREASTIYMNEGFTSTQDGNDSLIRLVETVGDDRKLRLGHGTINPESIAEYGDKVWWWNVYKGAVIRYTNEGLVAISDDGMKNYFYRLSRLLLPYKEQSKVYGVYDPYLDYYVLTFAPVPAAGYLGETFAFSESDDSKGPVGWFSFAPEAYAMINNTVFSFKEGQLWKHDDILNCNTFYGIKYDRVLRFVANADGNDVKIWANYRVDAESMAIDMNGDKVLIKLTNKEGQEGRVYAHQIEQRESVFVGSLKQDVNSPNVDNIGFNSPTDQENYFMYNGDVLRSQVCEVEITNDRADISPLYFVTLLYRKSEVSFK